MRFKQHQLDTVLRESFLHEVNHVCLDNFQALV